MNDLVLVQGMHETRQTLKRWRRSPLSVIGPWLALSLAITISLLLSVFAIAKLQTPDPTTYFIPGYHDKATFGDYMLVLYRNSLVLALHALACVAGFIAGNSLPLSAANRDGFSRWVHDKAGPLAIAFVVGATAFSLCTQAFVLGGGVASTAHQLGISEGTLLLALAPHALPELTMLFLPLAAWMIASRARNWNELLAATFVTVAIAVPVIMASAAVELLVSPHLLQSLTG